MAAFRARLLEDEPKQLEAVIDLAGRAWRRALTADEQEGLRELYGALREREIDHEKAVQLTLARRADFARIFVPARAGRRRGQAGGSERHGAGHAAELFPVGLGAGRRAWPSGGKR